MSDVRIAYTHGQTYEEGDVVVWEGVSYVALGKPRVSAKQVIAKAALAAAMIIAFAVVLGGCATVSGGQGGNACQIMKAIRPQADDADKVSVELGRQIVAHNRYIQEVCGVQP